MTYYFFDSHGALCVTCNADDPGAAAFGPTGIARPADPAEAGLECENDETAWASAERGGRLCRASMERDPGPPPEWVLLCTNTCRWCAAAE